MKRKIITSLVAVLVLILIVLWFFVLFMKPDVTINTKKAITMTMKLKEKMCIFIAGFRFVIIAIKIKTYP